MQTLMPLAKLSAQTSAAPSLAPASTRQRLWYAVALALGLALRLWFVWRAPRVDGDSLVYGDFAHNLLLHGIYGFTRVIKGVTVIRPTLIRVPGYPFFLALCFRIFGVDRYEPVMVMQALADLWTCVLVAGTAGRLFGQRARLAAIFLACLCPFTASYTADPLTETLTLLCIAAAFYGLVRWQQAGARFNRWLYWIAAALAYAILLRPEQGLLAAAVVPAMIWISLKPGCPMYDGSIVARGVSRSRDLSGAADQAVAVGAISPADSTKRDLLRTLSPVLVASLLTLLPLIPWAIRNYRVFHVIQPLAPRFATDPGEFNPLGFGRWYRTWGIDFATTESVYWKYDGAPILITDLPTRAFDNPQQYRETAALLDDYNQITSATPAIDARFNALASERIAARPFRYYVLLPIARVINMSLRPRTEDMKIANEWWHFSKTPKRATFALCYAGLDCAYFVLALLGFYLWKKNGWEGNRAIASSLAASILLRVALLLTIDNSEARYTLEFFPVLIVFAAALWRPATSRKA